MYDPIADTESLRAESLKVSESGTLLEAEQLRALGQAYIDRMRLYLKGLGEARYHLVNKYLTTAEEHFVGVVIDKERRGQQALWIVRELDGVLTRLVHLRDNPDWNPAA
jgi:hypothetical protein